jgi:hypothetical protein
LEHRAGIVALVALTFLLMIVQNIGALVQELYAINESLKSITKELYAVNQTLESISQAKRPSPPLDWVLVRTTDPGFQYAYERR